MRATLRLIEKQQRNYHGHQQRGFHLLNPQNEMVTTLIGNHVHDHPFRLRGTCVHQGENYVLIEQLTHHPPNDFNKSEALKILEKKIDGEFTLIYNWTKVNGIDSNGKQSLTYISNYTFMIKEDIFTSRYISRSEVSCEIDEKNFYRKKDIILKEQGGIIGVIPLDNQGNNIVNLIPLSQTNLLEEGQSEGAMLADILNGSDKVVVAYNPGLNSLQNCPGPLNLSEDQRILYPEYNSSKNSPKSLEPPNSIPSDWNN